MIKSQLSQRVESKDKIARHSSQIVNRRPSTNSVTVRDEDVETQNIHKTTFLIKRTGGLENSQQVVKRVDSVRNLQMPNLKLQTQVSEEMKASIENDSGLSMDSKLTVLCKAQKELAEEVDVLNNEEIPKLNVCQQIFESLNKNIKLAYKGNIKSTNTQLESMLDQYFDIASVLFQKICRHASDYINSIKCGNLIMKNIELEKENNRIMELHLRQQGQLYRRKLKESLEASQCVSFKSIDYGKILMNNSNVAEPKNCNQKNAQDISIEVLKPLLKLNSDVKVGPFELAKSAIEVLISEKIGHEVIKRVINDMKRNAQTMSIYLSSEPSGFSYSLSEDLVVDILKFNFNRQVMEKVKTKLLELSNFGFTSFINEDKVSVKELISLMHKFTFIRDSHKQREIILNLIVKSELCDRGKVSAVESEILSKYLNESSEMFQTLSIFSCPDKNQNPIKIQKVSTKKVINCASFSESKKLKTNTITRRNTTQIGEFQNCRESINEPLKSFFIRMEEVLLILYFFVCGQLEFIQHTMFTYYKINDEVGNYEQFQTFLEKVVREDYMMSLEECDKKEKQSLFELTGRLSETYDNSYQEESKVVCLKEVLKLIEGEILESIGREEKWNKNDGKKEKENLSGNFNL